MQAFHNVLLDTCLDELGFSSLQFTRERVVVGGNFVPVKRVHGSGGQTLTGLRDNTLEALRF